MVACTAQPDPEPEQSQITKNLDERCFAQHKLVRLRCPFGLHYDHNLRVCDWPSSLYTTEYYDECWVCGEKFPVFPDPNSGDIGGGGGSGGGDYGGGGGGGDTKVLRVILSTSGQEQASGSAFIPSNIRRLTATWYANAPFPTANITVSAGGGTNYYTGSSWFGGGGTISMVTPMSNTTGHFTFQTMSSNGGACTITN